MSDALLAALAVVGYVGAVIVLACAALYLIARDMDVLDEDAARERSRMDLL